MLSKIMIFFIEIYRRVISRYLIPGAHCRFRPTCSEYALLAYKKYGFLKGSFLAIKRVLKCHPFNPGGDDPLI